MQKKDKKGFTLIEILVVIAIAGLISSLVLVTVSSARAKNRETKRKVDLKEIEKALQFYYADNRSFPMPGNGWDVGYNYNAEGRAEWLDLQTALNPYISKLPTDPSLGDSISWNGYMYYDANVPAGGARGQGYTLISYPTEFDEPGLGCNFGWYQTNYPNRFICIVQ